VRAVVALANSGAVRSVRSPHVCVGNICGSRASAYRHMRMLGRDSAVEVDSAAEMVAEPSGCSIDDAIVKIKDDAGAVSRAVLDPGQRVIAGLIRFGE